MHWLSTHRFPPDRRHSLGLSVAVALVLMLVAGTAIAAEIASDDVYHLAEGEVVQDDLVVFAREITIDGTVEGDLIALGQVVTVNGMVTEDLIVAGAQVEINGVVQDDLRAGGAAVHLNGRVGDDVFMAGGSPVSIYWLYSMGDGQGIAPTGLQTGPGSSVGGNGYFVGWLGTLDGVFRNDLYAAIDKLVFNAEVEGDAVLSSSDLTFGESAHVAGNLEYTAPSESGEAAVGGVITKESPEEEATSEGRQRSPVVGFGWWLLRTILMIAGVGLAGALLMTFSKTALTRPVDTIQEKTAIAGLYGLLVAVAAIPLSAAAVFVAALFFGWFWGGVASFAFLFGFLILAWVLSPVVTGLWLGRQVFAWTNVQRSDLYALLVGASIIVLAGRTLGAIPCAGFLAYLVIYLLSFAMAAGGILLSRGPNDASAAEASSEAASAEETSAAA